MRLEIADTLPVSPGELAKAGIERRRKLMGLASHVKIQSLFREPEEITFNKKVGVAWTFGTFHRASATRISYDSSNLTLLNIAKIIADYFGLDMNDMRSSTRGARLAYARHIAMYFGRKMTPKSLPLIGRVLGNRDHTTVLHGVRKIERLLAANDETVRRDVDALRLILEG